MKLIAIATTILVTLALAGCGEPAAPSKPAEPHVNELRIYQQKLPDGREVTCLSYRALTATAPLSCDWANAK